MTLLCPFSDADDAPRLPLLAEAVYAPGELDAPLVPLEAPTYLARATLIAEARRLLRCAAAAGPDDINAASLRTYDAALGGLENGLRVKA